MIARRQNKISLLLPSKGRLSEVTLNFLRKCGLKVCKPNPRRSGGFISDLTRWRCSSSQLRAIGGCSVVVPPVRYNFEVEPPRYLAMPKVIETLETGKVEENI
jgi:hypothetical protein